MSRLLRPMQRGFRVLNGAFMAPLVRSGLGWLVGNPLTGYIFLLRTRGSVSGRVREAPLGYVLRDGAVWCVAGWGERTPWCRNLLADPAVEVVLPGRRPFRGVAAPVLDDAEWLAAYRALLASFGMLGWSMVGDVAALSNEELLARHRSLPVIRIAPADPAVDLAPGPFDPGGLGWIAGLAAWLGATLVGLSLWRLVRRACTTGGCAPTR